jgi:hypothetical protein
MKSNKNTKGDSDGGLCPIHHLSILQREYKRLINESEYIDKEIEEFKENVNRDLNEKEQLERLNDIFAKSWSLFHKVCRLNEKISIERLKLSN